jgi:hypothetical protein
MKSNIVMLVLVLSVGLLAAVAIAAPGADAKARGIYNFYASKSHSSFSSARSNVEGYQTYLRDTHGVSVPAQTPTAATVSVGRPSSQAPQAAGSTLSAVDYEAEITTYGAVDPEVAREATDALGDDIERIQRWVKRMRTHAEDTGDKESLAILADIEKNLGVARRGHADLHQHHAEDVIAPKTAMALAQTVNGALRIAHADHDKLMKRLNLHDDSDAK